jgi:hypothetical protein
VWRWGGWSQAICVGCQNLPVSSLARSLCLVPPAALQHLQSTIILTSVVLIFREEQGHCTWWRRGSIHPALPPLCFYLHHLPSTHESTLTRMSFFRLVTPSNKNETVLTKKKKLGLFLSRVSTNFLLSQMIPLNLSCNSCYNSCYNV